MGDSIEPGKFGMEPPTFWKRVRLVLWGLAIFVGMVLWRSEVLTLPPYEDQAVGYWNEADYLREHHFNYFRFLFVEPNFMDETPGRRSYGISILAPLLAGLEMLLGDGGELRVVCHVLWFALLALMAALVTSWLIPWAGRATAYLVSVAMVTTPSLLVQAEILGMDIPVASVMLVSAILAVNDRHSWAIALSFLAFSMKATGMMMTLALITYFVVMLMFDPRTNEMGRPSYGRSLRWSLALVVLEVLLESMFDTSVAALVGLRWLPVMRPSMVLTTAPDVLLLLILVTLLACLSVFFGGLEVWRGERASFGEWLHDRRAWLISWILVGGFVAAIVVHCYVPRYIVPAIPFLFFLVGWNLGRLRWARPLAVAGLMSLIVFNVLNVRGEFFPPLSQEAMAFIEKWPALDRRSCALTERSGEYLSDLRSNRKLCGLLEREFGDHPIIAAEPFYSYLSIPSLGYVNRKLDVRLAANASQTIRMLAELRSAKTSESSRVPVVIWKRSARSLLPDRSEEDELIFQDDLSPKLEAYLWHSVEKVPKDERSLAVWYVPRTRRGDLVELSRIDFFMRTGRAEFARRELREWKEKLPSVGLFDELLAKVELAAETGKDWDQVRSAWSVKRELPNKEP
jgi:hypothetical protein